jgi:hypothetical protein
MNEAFWQGHWNIQCVRQVLKAAGCAVTVSHSMLVQNTAHSSLTVSPFPLYITSLRDQFQDYPHITVHSSNVYLSE